MNLPPSLITTLYSFYDHNWPLVIFGGLSLFFLFLAVVKPSKKFILLFIGFALLTIEFEYQKHLFTKIQTDMIDLIFPETHRFWKYKLAILILEVAVPLGLKIVGWSFVVLAFFTKLPRATVR